MECDILIGAGGWGYFSGGLPAYSGMFGFVEVNTTFYRLPPPSQVDRWRRTVPVTFNFSVKANRQITHTRARLDSPGSIQALGDTAHTCDHLKARWLVLEFPPWREFDDPSCTALRNLLSSADVRGRVCIEARAYRDRDLPPGLKKMMSDLQAVDVVDPLVQDPRIPLDHAYARVFGKGEHNVYQPSDEELEDADDRLSRGGFKSIVFTFHGVRMYKDAARFETFRRTGRFPKVTRGEGLQSLEEVLREDASFPSTREELVRHQGWKLIDLAESKRVRASILLSQLEDRTYRSSSDVVLALSPSTSSKV